MQVTNVHENVNVNEDGRACNEFTLLNRGWRFGEKVTGSFYNCIVHDGYELCFGKRMEIELQPPSGSHRVYVRLLRGAAC